MKKIILVANPKSGKFSSKMMRKLESICVADEYLVETYLTKYAGHASEIVSSINQCDLLISIGGDGTFNEVLNGNKKRQNPLIISHVPAGTTNDLKKHLGLNGTPKKILKEILAGEIRTLNCGNVNDKMFAYHIATGIFSSISYSAPVWLKKRIGYGAYIIWALKEVCSPIKTFDIKLNGEDKSASLLIVGTSCQIGGIKMLEDVHADGLTVMYSSVDSWRKVILALLNKKKRSKVLQTFPAKNIMINTGNTWCIDGEKLEGNDLQCRSASVWMQLPKKQNKQKNENKNPFSNGYVGDFLADSMDWGSCAEHSLHDYLYHRHCRIW